MRERYYANVRRARCCANCKHHETPSNFPDGVTSCHELCCSMVLDEVCDHHVFVEEL